MTEIRYVDLSVVIPTFNRLEFLLTTLQSVAQQNIQPKEIIIIDGSGSLPNVKAHLTARVPDFKFEIVHLPAETRGAAAQRIQGIKIASYPVIGFFDDDIVLEENCVEQLWHGLLSRQDCGGINAVITNQQYHPPGAVSRLFYKLIGINTQGSLAGKCVGPALTFLPVYAPGLPAFTEVEWLNTTCTLYRKDALPDPAFDPHFTGYSLMEDLALSLRVRRHWVLLNATRAKIFHNSQPGDEKSDLKINAEMELVNRYYIMKNILNQQGIKSLYQLFMQQLFSAIASKQLFAANFWKGKLNGIKEIRKSR